MQNKKYTRIISMLLIASMISTGTPITGYATEMPEELLNEAAQENIEFADAAQSEPVEYETETQSAEITDFGDAVDENAGSNEISAAEDELPEIDDGTSTAENELPEMSDGTSAAEDELPEMSDGTSELDAVAQADAEFEYKDIAWLQSKITSQITLSSDNGKIETINIQNSSGLIFLSQLSPELYQTAEILLSQTSATAYFDITSNHPINKTGNDWKEGDSEKYIYHPMGSEAYPFCGSINYGTYKIVGTTPLFDYLGGATIAGNGDTPLTLARYNYLSSESVSPILANHYVSTDTNASQDSTPKEYSVKLEKYNGLEFEPKFDGIIGDIADGVNLTLNVTNEKESDIEGSENAGFICNTLGNSNLNINLLSPIKNNVKASKESAGGLIGYVKSGAKVNVNCNYEYQGTVIGQKNAGGLIGTLERNATVTVTGNTTVSGKISAITGDAGGLVGDVGSAGTATGGNESFSDGGSTGTTSITVTGIVSTVTEGKLSVSSDSAAAGGIVGNMTSGSSLSIGNAENRTILDNKLIVSGSAAGALLGKGEDIKLSGAYVTIGAESLDQAPNVSGKNDTNSNNSIGGLIGTYKTTGAEASFTAYNGATDSTLQVKSVNLSNTENSGDKLYAGGLIGVLDLCGDFSVSSAQITSSMAGVANYGGLAGQIISSSTVTEKLQQFTVSGDANIDSSNTFSIANDSKADLVSYGGIAACADKVSVKLDNTVAVTATECGSMTTANHYFGGVVAKLGNDSVLDISDDANYSLTASGIIYGGGVAGYTGQGSAVRLAGTTDLSQISFTNNYSVYYNQSYGTDTGNNFGGQIVGAQDSSLIYATKAWVLRRPATAQPIDDIGNYGSVIRLGKNRGCGSKQLGEGMGLDENLIAIDENTHKIKLKSELKSEISGNTINITNENQFALLAIAEQSKGYFSVYDIQQKDTFILQDGVINVINFTKDINLQSTGITGLQRDCYLGTWAFPGTVEEANVNGNKTTITLAVGETFGYRDNIIISNNTVSGSGQIHGHAQVGLFSQANGSFKDITFTGNINLWEREGTTKEVGAATAVNTWETSYENVATNVIINSLGNSESYSHIGGLIGRKNNDALTIKNCVGNATINAENSNNVAYGGILGYFTGKGIISVDALTLTGSIKDKNINDARVGGFVSVVDKNADLTMTLNNLTVEGQEIETDASATSGGLLGYDWNNTKVTFKGIKNTVDGAFGVKVAGDSKVKVTGNASCGALVYCATGYWQVNSIDLGKMSVSSGSGDLGLLACKAIFRDGDTNLFLYLEETSHGAYNIGNEVNVTNVSGNFDEWVVYTADSADKIVGNECSVISIATVEGNRVAGSRVGVDPADDQCTSYQNRTAYGKTAAANPNARYYYDLDVIRAKFDRKESDKKIDSAEELMLWSVYQYTLSNTWDSKDSKYPTTNISSYFADADAASATIDGNGKNIDLTSYSYYPVQVKTTTTVTNIHFTFANKEIERAEKKTDDSLDSLNRKTSGTSTEHTQHYLMHYGLFANVYGGVTLSASNVSFGGTVGYSEGTSGALVCGIAQGESSTRILNIKLSGITLDGVKLYDGNDKFDTNGFAVTDKYSALLINQIGNYSTFEVERKSGEGAFGIKTTDKYSNAEHNITYYAAGSMIGTVGSANGTYIHMNFLGTMALDGRDTSNTVKTYDERYGTCHSVFTRATLLESFQYPTNETSSGGFYNFNKEDVCTYGKEISNISSGRNQENQYWYYDDKTETGYVKDSTTGADAKNDADGKTGGFSTGYLRYVQVVENKSGNWELDINQKQVYFDKGCGTYGHPYLVDSADQLIAIMDILDTATFKPGFVIQVNSKILNDSRGDFDYHNTTSTNDKLLYYDGTIWSIALKDGDSYKAGTTNETVDKSKLLKYIRNAYYMVTDDISLDVSSFRGIGSHELTDSANTGGAFSGVIIGQKKSDDNYPTITLHGTTARDNFGGLVRYSQGSVIKDLNIKYEKTDKNILTINKKDNTCVLETQPFFGGVIGWAFGGDSIIDNVNVTYDKNYIQIGSGVTPAGGYVGIVGGDTSYGGGVVFRNISNANCDFYIKNENSKDNTKNYYWNPFVGRTYDGYICYDSVNSSDSNKSDQPVYLQNTDKNYTIPNLMSTDKLSVDRWSETLKGEKIEATVTIGSAEQLWVLSAIVSSGAGGADTNGSYTNQCNAYSYGKVRSGKYDSIGSASREPDYLNYDEEKWGGNYKYDNMKKIPYLIRNYTSSITGNSGTEYPMVRLTGNDTFFKLSITNDCDMRDYQNGFRGIGPVYPTGGSNYIITSAGTINAKMERKIIRMSEVSGPSDKAVKITMQRTLNVPNNGESWTCATLGLFTYLHVYTDLNISNIKVRGKLEVNNDVTGTNTDYLLGGIAGGIVKSDNTGNSVLTFDNVHIEDLKITSASSPDKLWGRHAGGFLGAAYFVKECVFNNCGYNTLTIQNTRWTAGGFIGNVMKPVTVKGKTVIQDGVFDQNVNLADAGVSGGYVSGNWYAIGGLFGYNESTVNINQTNNTDKIQANNINMSGWVTGGLVGASVIETKISNVEMNGYSAIGLSTIASASGGIIGLYSTKTSVAKTANLTLDNISVSNARILLPKATIPSNNIGSSAGGIVGSSRMDAKSRDLIIKTKCQVSDSTIVSYGSVGGLIGDSGNLLSGSSISNAVVSNCKIVSSRYDANWSGVGGFIGMTSSAIKGYNLYSKDNMVGYLLNNNNLWSKENYDNLKTDATVGEITFTVLNPEKITKDNVGLVSSASNSTSYCAYATYLEAANLTPVAVNSRVGIWIGNTGDDNQDIQLIAVRRSGDYTAVHNFGRAANSANTRVIYNDYTGVGTAKMKTDAEKSSTDETWPYVAENPEHTFSTDKGNYERYGDGMGFTSKSDEGTTQIPIAEKIAKETEQVAANPKGYSNTGYKYFYDDCEADFKDNKWKYESSFASFLQSEELQSNTNLTDFPVLVVEDSSEINTQIKETLKLLTNSNYVDTALADISQVECNVLSLNDDSKFVVGESKVRTVDLAASNASIWYDTDNKVFRARNAVAFDSGKKQFTLVTVTLGSDPNDATKKFKVSLAVYVQKNIYFKFYASGISGTTYETQSYIDNNSAVMTNYGDSFTEMLSFEFGRTNEEWLQALNAGENLCVSYDKAIWLGDMNLPSGTRFVLVDPQQSGQTAYYASSDKMTGNKQKLFFSDFAGWKDVTISDYLKAKATVVNSLAEGTKFVKVENLAEATVKCDSTYYRMSTPEENENTAIPKYTISFENTNPVTYNYYLTIVTPENESGEMLNNIITYEDTWLNCGTEGGIRAKNNNTTSGSQKVFAKHDDGNENRYIIYNFFTQTIEASSVTPGSLLLDDTTKTATVSHAITNKINLNKATEFRKYATDNTKLFQRFDMSLKDVEDSKETSTVIAAGTRYEIAYVIETTDADGKISQTSIPGYTGTISTDCTTYSFPYASQDVLDSIIGYFKTNGYDSITMRATLNLIYDEETLYKQFKVKEGSSDQNDFGLRYSFTSKLSMNENTIAATSVKKQASVGTLFYRSSYELAKLSYNAVDGVATTERSGDISKLGINAFSSREYQELLGNPSKISSMAGYDVTAMKNREDGAKIHCVFRLYCKDENGEYQQVTGNISNYLTAPKIRGVSAEVNGSSYVLNFDMTEDEKKTYATVPITFMVDYAVNTEEKLPANAAYSNYKVVLTVDMLKEDGTSLDMEAEDYIIYTNAKINPAIQPRNQ